MKKSDVLPVTTESHVRNGAGDPPSLNPLDVRIRRAVAEEREACARLVDQLGLKFIRGGLARAADEIALAIRRRPSPEDPAVLLGPVPPIAE